MNKRELAIMFSDVAQHKVDIARYLVEGIINLYEDAVWKQLEERFLRTFYGEYFEKI